MNNNTDREPALRFSQRIGKKPVKCDFQIESMDDDLRNGLWNIVWEVAVGRIQDRDYLDVDDDWRPFLTSLWHSFFKWPVDEVPWSSAESCQQKIKKL